MPSTKDPSSDLKALSDVPEIVRSMTTSMPLTRPTCLAWGLTWLLRAACRRGPGLLLAIVPGPPFTPERELLPPEPNKLLKKLERMSPVAEEVSPARGDTAALVLVFGSGEGCAFSFETTVSAAMLTGLSGDLMASRIPSDRGTGSDRARVKACDVAGGRVQITSGLPGAPPSSCPSCPTSPSNSCALCLSSRTE